MSRELHSIAMGSSLRWPVEKLISVDFEGCDLRGSELERSWRRRMTVRDCTFSNTRLDPFDSDRVDFESCQLRKVDIGRGGTWFRHATLTDVLLEQCDVRHTNFQVCTLTNVDFCDCRFRRTMFHGGRLERVRFTGRGGIIFFNDATLVAVDLSSLVPDDITFYGSNLSRTQLPHTTECFVVRAAAFLEVMGELRPLLSEQGLRHVAAELEGGRPDDLRTIGPDWLSLFEKPGDGAIAVEALYRFALESV